MATKTKVIEFNIPSDERFSIFNLTRSQHLKKKKNGTLRTRGQKGLNGKLSKSEGEIPNFNNTLKKRGSNKFKIFTLKRTKEWSFNEVKHDNTLWDKIFEETTWQPTDDIQIIGNKGTEWKYGTEPWDSIKIGSLDNLPIWVRDDMKHRLEQKSFAEKYRRESVSIHEKSLGQLELMQRTEWEDTYYEKKITTPPIPITTVKFKKNYTIDEKKNMTCIKIKIMNISQISNTMKGVLEVMENYHEVMWNKNYYKVYETKERKDNQLQYLQINLRVPDHLYYAVKLDIMSIDSNNYFVEEINKIIPPPNSKVIRYSEEKIKIPKELFRRPSDDKATLRLKPCVWKISIGGNGGINDFVIGE